MIGWLLGIAVVVAGVIAIGIRVPAVQDRIVGAAIDRMVASQPNELFEKDALRVLACGTASPVPHPTRASAASFSRTSTRTTSAISASSI
jgi:ribonuclease Z